MLFSFLHETLIDINESLHLFNFYSLRSNFIDGLFQQIRHLFSIVNL